MTNAPESPAQRPDDRMILGGNFWTLFTPRIWKVLHAVLHVSCHREGELPVHLGQPTMARLAQPRISTGRKRLSRRSAATRLPCIGEAGV
jgi:hypothetical protein